MGVFDTIGNWFRGAFGGETDEEKKRRQQQQQAAQQPKIKVAQPKQPTLTVSNKPQPLTFDQPKQTATAQPQQNFSADLSQPVLPSDTKLTVAKAPTQQFKLKAPDKPTVNTYRDFSLDGGTDKKLFGLDVGQFMGRFGKTYKMSLDKDTKLTQGDFLKGYSNLSDEARRVYTDKLIQQAKGGDATAFSTLKTLNDADKLKGNFSDFLESANQDFYENTLAKPVSYLFGKGGENYRKDLDTRQREMSNFGAGKLGQELDPGTVGLNVGLTVAGGMGAAKLAELGLTKIPAIANFIQGGGKIAGWTAKGVPILADSLGATAAQDAINRVMGHDTNIAQDAATGVAIDATGHVLLNRASPIISPLTKFFKGSNRGTSIVDDILKESNPKNIQRALGVDAGSAAVLAGQKDPNVVRQMLKEMSLDPAFKLNDDVMQRLEDEGISAVKKNSDDQYPASYDPSDRSISARDQSSLDQNVYHELGHDMWANKLTPEEKALFKGEGDASKQATGREGYTQDDVDSEDFSDYMNKALTGRMDEVPQQFRTVVAKYAKIALEDPSTAGSAVRTIAQNEKSNLDNYLKTHPNMTEEEVAKAMNLSKERAAKLIDESQASRQAATAAVDKQLAENATNSAELGQQAEEAAAAKAALTNPNPENVVQATPAKGTNAEAQANDAYQQFNKEAGLDSGSQDVTYLDAQQQLERMAGNKTLQDLEGRQGFRIPTSLNQNTQGALADALTDATGKGTGSLLTSQNPVLHALGETLFSLNKKSTLTNPMKTLVEQVKGRTGGIGNLRGDVVKNIETPLKALGTDGEIAAKEKVFQAFEAYNNGDTTRSLAIIKSFSPEERAYFDNVRELNVLRNNLNKSTMDAGVIDQYDNGMHMPRLYDMEAFAKEFSPDDIESFAMSQGKTLDLNPAKRRKQIDEVAEGLQQQMLRDPAEASAVRTEIALHNKAVSEYASKVGLIPDAVSDVPLKGYLPIPNSPRYGESAGKYIRKDLAEPILSGSNKFSTDTYKAVDTILNKYQSSILGKLEQGLRKGLTVYNPATRLGNRGANLAQGAMAGFNLPEMAVSQQHFLNVLKNGGDEWTRLAKTFGAIDNTDAMLKFSGGMTDPTGALKGVRQGLSDSYQNVDNAAKVAMFKWQIQRGASPEDAARFVNRALPNIGNSGELYSFFSRLPVLGTPFRAIQPEVLRALGSTMGRNTVPFLVAMATYTTLQNATWKDVPPEERQQVQERFGSGNTPFKGINDFFGSHGIQTDKVLPSSWSFNAAGIPGVQELFKPDPETGERPIVDVDPRRLMGMYSINLGGDTPADSLIDTASKAAPMNVPIGYDNGQWSFEPQNIISSRVFSPIWQTAIDTDFRGKSVQEPDRTNVNVVDPTTGQPLSNRDNPGRAAQFLLRSYIPQVNDVANVVDAAQGKENFYGQDMNLPQSIARLFGLKGEQFTSKNLQDQKDTQAYFDDKATIDNQLKDMTPTEQAAWKRLTGYDKLDQKETNSFGTESWKKAAVYNFGEDKWKDYAANPRLYDLMVQKKQQDAARDGSPIQPEFDERLSAGFRKQLIQNKMVAPGDDAELDQRMYASPEWDYYQKLKDQYSAAAKKYYGDSQDDNFSDELVKHQDAKFPTKPAAYQDYTDAYAQYADGKAPKPEFTDAVKAAKDAYNKATLDWTNKERKARGLPAITWDVWNNPTFGFDTSASGYGYGSGGSGGTNTLSALTDFSNDVSGDAIRKIDADNMPNIVALFQKLQAGGGGGRAKPKLGASASGR